jgi:dTDP-4-amino-4,6-dideoxygalactose transaminase
MSDIPAGIPPSLHKRGRPLPVARPLLPSAASVAGYLTQIDQSRIYSNFGPLCQRFESRLAALYGVAAENVATMTNATTGLTCALLAATGGAKGLCYLPSWTFCASAHAVRLAGLEPHFLDVNPDSWQITPSAVRAAVKSTGERGAVMVVAPFGAPVNVDEWDAFSQETGMKIVIDAAGSFAAQKPGSAPVIISLHATKALGIGEGGFVVSRDADVITRIRQIANFGFHGTRTSEIRALNGKLSEIGAAVGLAALDRWSETLQEWLLVHEYYWNRLAALGADIRVARQCREVSSTLVARFPVPGERVTEAFAEREIHSRRWWGHGCHREPAFADCRREALPTTNDLAEHTLGLPLFVDMSQSDIEAVVECVEGVLRGSEAANLPHRT